MQKREEVDFKVTSIKLSKNGYDMDKLTELDAIKLKNGSKSQIKNFLRYGFGMGHS